MIFGLPACAEPFVNGIAKAVGFNLHDGVAASANKGKKLEGLCRWIGRPAVPEDRLSLTPNGTIRYRLKTLWQDGAIHVIVESLDAIARLVALVPKPWVNLTRFQDVLNRAASAGRPSRRQS